MLNKTALLDFVKSAKESVAAADTTGYSEGKYNHHLSKAFVAQIGQLLKQQYSEKQFETRFQNYNAGKGESGEWLYDIAVVELTTIKTRNQVLDIPKNLVIALESEMNPGAKDFIADFTKLIFSKANNKIYINGILTANKIDTYIKERLTLAQEILVLTGCTGEINLYFIDAPRKWVLKHPTVRHFKYLNAEFVEED